MEASPDLLTLAKERFAVRDYHGAVLLLGELLRGGKAFADAQNLFGLCLAMIGRSDDALAAFDEALRLNPGYVEAHLNRAVVLNQVGRTTEAESAIRRAAQFSAASEGRFPAVVANRLSNAHARLGDDYRAAGAINDAIEQYRRALELRPAFADIRLTLGRALMEAGNFSEAARELDDLLLQRPDWLDALLVRGLAAYLEGRLDTAGRVWEEAGRTHPSEPRLEIYRNMLARRLSGA